MGTTPNLGLPYPEDTDPIGNTAAAVEALANAVDTAHPQKWRRGAASGTTDASGYLTITHGLGTTPTAVLATCVTNGAYIVIANTFTATTFKIRFLVSSTGAAAGSAAVAASWLAIV